MSALDTQAPVDSELELIIENDEKPPCVSCEKPATHSACLSCNHSFLVCDRHTQRVRDYAAILGEARCVTCKELTTLKSLNPI